MSSISVITITRNRDCHLQKLIYKHEISFEERLAAEATRFREAAKEAKLGLERELLLRQARQAETASQMSQWLRSPSMQPPN